MSEIIKSYGICPKCDTPCQPPDFPDNGLEFCFCCDCKIVWNIVHNESNMKSETWEEVFPIVDIETFEDVGFVPYGCED